MIPDTTSTLVLALDGHGVGRVLERADEEESVLFVRDSALRGKHLEAFFFSPALSNRGSAKFHSYVRGRKRTHMKMDGTAARPGPTWGRAEEVGSGAVASMA